MNILICDDIKKSSAELAELLRDLGYSPVVYNNGYDALEYLQAGVVVDVCFLDILMPEMNGIDLADELRKNGFSGEIIFLSSSNEYAYESYQVKAFQYLLKPPTKKSVECILRELEQSFSAADSAEITVNTKSMTKFIKYRELSHIEVIQHTVHFGLMNGDIVEAYATFNSIAEQLLQDNRFIQCHRSFVVNMTHIDFIADGEITMRTGRRIPISRGYPNTRSDYLKWKFGGGKV